MAPVTTFNLPALRLVPDGGDQWALSVSHRAPDPGARRLRLDSAVILGPVDEYRRAYKAHTTTYRGYDALNALSLLLPVVNQPGASTRRIRDSVNLLDRDANAGALLARLASERPWSHPDRDPALRAIRPEYRLALEMALHEMDERRALEGELALLEERWRDAEEIAAISDSLVLPEGVAERMKELKGG